MSRPNSKTPRQLAQPPRVGDVVHRLRQSRRLSLEQLARQSGVSKSMLSQIERAQANPTVAVVWRLANALGLPIGELLRGEHELRPAITIMKSDATPLMLSDDGRCELRILAPIESAGEFEWYELNMKPGAALVSAPHEAASREHLTLIQGVVEVKSGDVKQLISAGATARYASDLPHAITNVGKSVVRALLVVVHR